MCAQSKTVTAEEAARLLHISKRKCSWMLQNGHIPCIDTGKKTKRYTIAKGHLKSASTHGEPIIAQAWLADFCCHYGYHIVKKSEKHKNLEESFFKPPKNNSSPGESLGFIFIPPPLNFIIFEFLIKLTLTNDLIWSII